MNRRAFLAGAVTAGGFTAALSPRAFASSAGDGYASSQVAASPRETPASELADTIQMCVFDTFGTVVDWRGSVIAEVAQLAREKGLTIDAPAFADAWRANYSPSLNRVRTGELPWTDLDTLHRMSLDALLVRFEIEGLSEDEKVKLNKVWHRLHPWPDAPGGLARLKKRYVLSPLSNGNLALLTHMAKFGGLPWDCVLGSDMVRHYKPDREMYLMPGEYFGLPPAAVLMVAAHPSDLDAAKSNGLRTAYVHRPLERGPDRPPTAMPETGRFDLLAADFDDLAAQLGV